MNPLKALFLLLILSSCAQIVIPDGGNKDESPPVLIKSAPETKSINIFPNKIVLYFDENIELKNQTENIYITPNTNFKPNIKVKKNRIELDIPKDSLLPNTTYCINFGKSVADINEGNILENFTYTFSTGNYLDTAFIYGIALSIKDNKRIENAKITLQNSKNLLKYSTSSNKAGEWRINNIAKGNYSLIIYSDNNSNKKLDFAESYFSGNIIITDSSILHKNKLITYSFANDSIKLLVKNATYINNNSIAIKFTKSVLDINKINYSLNPDLNKKTERLYATNKEDSFILYHPFYEKDTLILNIDTDTLQRIIIVQPKKRTKDVLTFNPLLTLVRKTDPIYINSSTPITNINSEQILLNGSNGDFDVKRINPYMFSITPHILSNKEIILKSGAIKDINGEENKGDTISIKIATEEETGNYEFIIKDTSSKYTGTVYVKITNQVNEYIIKTVLNKSNKLTGLLPGNYTIEVWEDENSNDKWDEGNYFNKQYPEKIMLIKDFIIIKPNWDTVGVEIYLD